MHFFDARFPLAAKARRREPDATVAAYQALQRRLGLARVVVVQPTAYGTDNRCTLAALAELGESARGVAVVDARVSDGELADLTRAGMRGVRFRMLEPPELPWELLETLAARVHAFGWHVQFQMDGRFLHEKESVLAGLPGPLVVEHLGKFLEPVGVDHPGFRALLRLIDRGRCWVKLSGAYMLSRTGPPDYEDIGRLARALVRHAPERMVWASNWPHPLAKEGAMPDDAALLDLLLDWAPDAAMRRRILADNPATLYGFFRAVA
jgi:D-galactarolactone isomerase